MDYKSIYDRFIKSRLNNPPSEDEYFERHHIVPRCMGGGNNPENLIPLIPEDHFFAHLVLAKAHKDTRLWAAVKIMASAALGSRNESKGWYALAMGCGRKRYADARRWAVKRLRGKGSLSYDHRVFDFVHKDGSQERCTKYDLCEKHGLDIRNLTSVVSGRKKSLCDWTTKETFESDGFYWGMPKGKNHPKYNHGKYNFKHRDGDFFYGTKYQFSKHSGVKINLITLLVLKKTYTSDGWYISDYYREYPCKYTRMAGKSPVIKLKNVDGRCVEGPKAIIRKDIGLTASEVSQILKGKYKSAKGWMLPETRLSEINKGGKPPIKKSRIYGTIIHDKYGRFTGNATDFRLKFYAGKREERKSSGYFGSIIKGRLKSWDGWRLENTSVWGPGCGGIGREPKNTDKKTYQFQSYDGLKFVGTRSDFCTKYGFDSRVPYTIIKADGRYQKNWRLKNGSIEPGMPRYHNGGERFNFINIDGRREDQKTAGEMFEKYGDGEKTNPFSVVVYGRRNSTKGWYIEGSKKPPNKANAKYCFANKDGLVLRGSIKEISGLIGVHKTSITNTIYGRSKTSKGWYFVNEQS